jgi:demethoxyubiquinone hydroxylase (CLK1/Coq7/Cat5 family)
MVSSGMLRRVALVRTDVSEELSASSIRVTRIGELGATLAVTKNRRTLRRNKLTPRLPLQRLAQQREVSVTVCGQEINCFIFFRWS